MIKLAGIKIFDYILLCVCDCWNSGVKILFPLPTTNKVGKANIGGNSMIKRLLVLTVLCCVALITACIDSTTTISVRKDGSGTITEKVFISKSFMSMMEGMFSQMAAKEGGEKNNTESEIDIEKYKGKAAQMGESVTFISARAITREDGSKGTKVVYAFKDVSKLKVEAEPDNPVGDKMAGTVGAEKVKEEKKSPIRFDFIKGRKPKLIIYMPQDKEKKAAEKADKGEAKGEEENAMGQAGMAMMKPFLQDFRIRVEINFPDAKIGKTNASFVEKINGKDTVTLIDMALGKILDNPDEMKKLEGFSRTKDVSKAMEVMKKIPGLKIETHEKVEVQMK